jgi:hypothetical protein
MKFLFATMARVSAAYVLAQIITGVEIGILAATMVVVAGWTLPGAMAVASPLGLPLVSLQMAGLIALQGRRNKPASNTAPSLT